jgi:hypothetical protein
MNEKELEKKFGLTGGEMDKIGEMFENDTWDERELGKVSVGRPSISDEPLRTMTLKVKESTFQEVDSRASNLGVTKSEYVRKLIARDLAYA